MTNAPPSVNPSNEGSMAGMFREILGKFLMNVDDMLPAEVIAFDRTSNLVRVQPLIMMVSTENERFQRAQVASIPVFQIGAGNCVLNFNLLPGDLGWIKANDRDISLFMQSFGESSPNTYRKHSFEDAVFFPSVLRNFVINAEDAENAVLQTIDGTQRVSIWPDRVKITSNNQITIDAPNTYVTGTLHVAVDVLSGPDAISSVHHVHDGVTPGGGDTGEPVP